VSVAPFTIQHIVTGELESSIEVDLLGGGASPDVTREQVLPYGYREDLERRDGTLAAGSMVPVPVWLIEGAASVTLIDTGLGPIEDVEAMQRRYGIDFIATQSEDQDLVAGLARHGVAPQDVEVVVLTHLHFDHVGNVELFPNARFVVQKDELALGLAPPRWATFYYPEDARRLHAIVDRFDVIDGDARIEPGLRAIKLGGHTPGQMATLVDTAAGRVCLASDAAYNYRNLALNWPNGSFWDLAAVMRGYARMKAEADIVVPNHDWRFRDRFPTGTIG
jgi:glyoxylase-like metal-dependent hydrolase (beta-lactamase superfamily II)